MPSSFPDVITICGYITAIGAALGLLWKGTSLVITLIKKINDFLDDWNGEPERPGVAAKLGVMERLERLENELKTNHGSSLRDAVNRVEQKLDEHIKSYASH